MKRLVRLFLLGIIVSSVVLNSCKKDEVNKGEVVCTIVQPIGGDTLQLGLSVEIVAEANYQYGTIKEIRFFTDGVEVGSSTKFPYNYEWETNKAESGWHTLKAEAKASDGTSGTDEMDILLIGEVTVAMAGNDILLSDGSTSVILSANEPENDYETGEWSIISGEGGVFEDSTKYNTVFTGNANTSYVLNWRISNKFTNSSDEVAVTFAKNGPGSPLTDVDGNTYNTVWINGKLWMAENLKVTKEADGTAIPLVTDNNDWGNLESNNTDKAYCYYINSTDSLAKYGALYTFAAAKAACPTGWHLPTDAEWTELENYIINDGFNGTEGTALKSTTDWNSNGNGTDDYGFSAMPGGYRNSYGSFDGVGDSGHWWSSFENSVSNAYTHNLFYDLSGVTRTIQGKSRGFSVRYIKD